MFYFLKGLYPSKGNSLALSMGLWPRAWHPHMRLWFKGSGGKTKPGRFGHQSHCSGQHRPHLVLPEDWEATQGQIQIITLLFSVTSHTWRGVSIKNKLPNRYQIWQTQFSIVGFFNTSGKTISILLLIFYSRNTVVHSRIHFSVTGPSSSPLDLSFGHEAWASLVAQMAKHLPAVQETRVQSLGQLDPLQEGMATHSSTLAWRIPWTESLASCSSWGSKQSDTTKWLTVFI